MVIEDSLKQPDAVPRRRRIVVITRSFPRLSETFVIDHVRVLIQAGHEVIVIARRVDAASVSDQFGSSLQTVQLPPWTAFGTPSLLVGARRAAAWMRRHPTLLSSRIAP